MMLRIQSLDNRVIASTASSFDGQWAWIQEVIARQFDCDADDVTSADTEDEHDMIVVKGEPVARLVRS